jgi:hypothetical protein
MGANRLWAKALEEGVVEGHEDIDLFAFNGPFSLSINHLAGLSLELLLKAAYVAEGGAADDKHLRNEIGHDLHRALDLAEGLGFQSQAPHLREIVERMSEPYRKHWFRYDRPNKFLLPDFEQINEALVVLEQEVEAICAPVPDAT